MAGRFGFDVGRGWKPYNKRNRIPGVSGRKRIPGSPRLPSPGGFNGFHLTRVPFLNADDASGEWGSSIFRERHRQQVRDAAGHFAGGTGFAWQGLSKVNDNLLGWEADTYEKIDRRMHELAAEMETWAKENASWTDDTGLARESLQAVVVREGQEAWSIWLGHGSEVYYGIWLEVRWGGKYAILLPTLMEFAPQLAGNVRSQT